jgi:hypothetical protein
MEGFFTEKQQENLVYFQENLEKFASDPLMKFKHIVIYNKVIAGIYDTFAAALTYAVQNLPQGEYVIQEVILDSDVVSFLYPAIA